MLRAGVERKARSAAKEAAEKVRKNIFGPRMNTDEHG
jgi:hypothetical protein